MILAHYLLISLAVSLIVFSLMWSAKLQGGAWEWLEDRASSLHDFIKYVFPGLLTAAIFTLIEVPLDHFWQWLAVLACGSLSCFMGEKFGTGWHSGAIVRWDADLYWHEMEKESFMDYPVFKQIIDRLPRNMFGVFMVVALRGLLWGIWFAPLLAIDFEFHKLIFAWVVALPAAHAMGAGFERSLTPNHGSWGRTEELRWLLTLLIAISL